MFKLISNLWLIFLIFSCKPRIENKRPNQTSNKSELTSDNILPGLFKINVIFKDNSKKECSAIAISKKSLLTRASCVRRGRENGEVSIEGLKTKRYIKSNDISVLDDLNIDNNHLNEIIDTNVALINFDVNLVGMSDHLRNWDDQSLSKEDEVLMIWMDNTKIEYKYFNLEGITYSSYSENGGQHVPYKFGPIDAYTIDSTDDNDFFTQKFRSVPFIFVPKKPSKKGKLDNSLDNKDNILPYVRLVGVGGASMRVYECNGNGDCTALKFHRIAFTKINKKIIDFIEANINE